MNNLMRAVVGGVAIMLLGCGGSDRSNTDLADLSPSSRSPDLGIAPTELHVTELRDAVFLRSVIWDGERYIAGGPDDSLAPHLYSSRDGLDWQPFVTDGLTGHIRTLAYSKELDRYVLGSWDGLFTMRRSEARWRLIAPGAFEFVTWIDGPLSKFIASVDGPTNAEVQTSSDGLTWENSTYPLRDGFIESIAYQSGGDLLAAVGLNRARENPPRSFVWISRDRGLSWTDVTPSALELYMFWGIGASPTEFVAVGHRYSYRPDQDYAPIIFSSKDGTVWTQVKAPQHPSEMLKTAYWSGESWVVAGFEGAFYRSSDGATWIDGAPLGLPRDSASSAGYEWSAAVAGNDGLVVVGGLSNYDSFTGEWTTGPAIVGLTAR